MISYNLGLIHLTSEQYASAFHYFRYVCAHQLCTYVYYCAVLIRYTLSEWPLSVVMRCDVHCIICGAKAQQLNRFTQRGSCTVLLNN
jgi:hypothetical protein